MTLHEWLEWKRWTDQQLADAMSVSREAARLWRHGHRMPGAEHIQRIRELTRGRVKEADLRLAHEARQAKKATRNVG